MIVVGIAGGSASGKSTIARAFAAELGDRALTIAHDRYYRTLPDAFRADPLAYNFDHPDALETSMLIEDIQTLRSGASLRLVDYDFHTCSRRDESDWTEVAPPEILVVEGILVLAVPELVSAFDHCVYVHTPADIRLARRLLRDTAERGDTPRSVIEQYLATVRPMHEAFVEPSRDRAALELDGTDPVSQAVAQIRARLG